jgi:hypothetical protein
MDQHPDFKNLLLTRHGADETICISSYKIVNGKFVVSERFCDGVEEAAKLIEETYGSENVGAIWTNIQRLKHGTTQRRKSEVEAYANLTVDIDRRWKTLHDDGTLCQHGKKQACGSWKCNATDEEIAALRQVAEKIAALLTPAFGPCTFSFSGNGWHLNWKLADLEPAEGERVYRKLLAMLKHKFESPEANVEIDASMADATQVVTVWGTWNRKYPTTPGRPQRQSKVLFMPDKQKPIRDFDFEIFFADNRGTDTPPAGPEEKSAPAKATGQKADPEWLENYGVPDLIDFWSPLLAYEEDSYDKGGEAHHPIAPCPCHEKEDFHPHSHHRDCEIIEFADGGIGISCFSGELSLKQVIAKMNAIKAENYPHRVFAEESDEEIAKAFGVESADAKSAAEQKAEADARKAEQDAFEPSTAEQPELKYPQLAFPYDALPEGRFKKLVDKACEGGLSPGLVVPAIMALASSLPEQDRVEGARVNMYVTLLSMVGAGKDTAIDRAGAVLGLRTDDAKWSESSCSVYTPSGERSVAMCIGDQPGTKENPARIPGPRTHCMITYELDETLRKNKGETSGVFSALQHFFDHNEKQYNDSKYRHKQTVNCRLSWLTALPVGDGEIDENIYRKAFGDSSSHGFVSRMLFGFAETRFDRRKTRNWHVPESEYSFYSETALDFGTIEHHTTLAEQIRNARCEGFAPGVAELYESWQPKRDWSGRDMYHALKVAAICAILQGHSHIEESDWRFAVAFIEWQGRIREAFQPGRAQKTTQAEFNEIVVREVERRTRKGLQGGVGKDKHTEVVEVDGKKRVYVRWKGMANDGKWYRHGLDTEKTVRMLVSGGTLAYKSDDETAWVRIIGWKPE